MWTLGFDPRSFGLPASMFTICVAHFNWYRNKQRKTNIKTKPEWSISNSTQTWAPGQLTGQLKTKWESGLVEWRIGTLHTRGERLKIWPTADDVPRVLRLLHQGYLRIWLWSFLRKKLQNFCKFKTGKNEPNKNIQ